MSPVPHLQSFTALLVLAAIIGATFVLLPDSMTTPPASFTPTRTAETSAPKNSDAKDIKAIYLTSNSAARNQKVQETIDLINETELNAVVIDIKDYEGSIMYKANHPEAQRLGITYDVIKDIGGLIERFHNEGVYVIARFPVFQDTELAEARPDLAVQNKSHGIIWRDRNGLAWVDPASREVWDYNIALMRDALNQGFDEINLDYIRFPSDGVLSDMAFPFWNETTERRVILRDFMRTVRRQLPDAVLSVDLFGFTTSHYDDLGIGQIIEDAYESFDYVAPMTYPSHYPPGYLGFANPAEHPAAVVRRATRDALLRLYHYEEPLNGTKLRFWIQDFDLGAVYDAARVRSQIDAMYGAFDSLPHNPVINGINGFMLWNSSNNYTKGALKSANQEY